ncbi:MAG: sigma-70 family RNA polymerase sigma factor [Ruminococcaceae bacterium]|nr:sigma-70 family RNA polymerase sigma factor [Oscillospiraceae bacterium]
MEDEKIIELYFAREEWAIEETDRKYGAYCKTIAWRILQNISDAEECVNDTWLRVWNAVPPQRPNVFRQFLAKITRNLSLDRWRMTHAEKRGGGAVEVALEELGECIGDGDPATAMELEALQKAIQCFLQTLSERDRNIFLRRYFYLEDTAAIARRYVLQSANVRLILSRARQKLREYLQKEGMI